MLKSCEHRRSSENIVNRWCESQVKHVIAISRITLAACEMLGQGSKVVAGRHSLTDEARGDLAEFA